MKRLSTKLLSSSKIITSSTSISGNFSTQCTTCSSSPSISKSLIQNLKPCSNSNALFYKPYKTHQFHKNPSHNYNTHVGITPYFPSNQRNNTHVGITPYFPSNQRNNKKGSQIGEVFAAVKSAKEMLEAFKKMEANLDEGELGLACLNIGLQLNEEGEDPQNILSFVNKALAVLDTVENKCSLPLAMTLQLLGSINCSLRKFTDALGFLIRANMILVKLEDDDGGKYGVNVIKTILHAVHMELANVETGMGRSKEAVANFRKCLEIKECLMGVDSREFGDANRDVAEMCVTIKNFKDGLLYCLKALEIHLGLLGENSVEVARDRRVLGVIYTGLEEYEKATEENRLAQKVFRNCGYSSDVIRVAIDAANILIARGKYEDALNMLKEHEKGVEENSENPLILMTMSKALIYQENFADAKGCLEIACREIHKKEKSKPLEVANAYIKIADQYETMSDFENAISLFMRAHALLEKLPEEKHLEAGVLTRIGSLLLLTGKATHAISYLERVAEIVKENYGSQHFGVGYIYNKLGRAYLELESPETAAEMFVVAKDILDVSLGPHHDESIHTCQNLSNAYAAMKSYPLAIDFQQKAVDAWEGRGCSAEDEHREARRLLEQLKVSARGVSSKDCPTGPTQALPLPHSSNASGGLQAPLATSPKRSG